MYQHLPSPIRFREDINGLRAWAVIAVLMFHFSLIGLPGGFAGVDVFFVISGYLMTAIIIGGYERGFFSIWKFYLSRIRRILPALMAVIIVLLALGWFWLPTLDYQTLGAQSAYALSFISNMYYWQSPGYFDSAAQEKWLLHTWSLAVEAQFYLLYPVFIAIIWKIWKSVKAVTIGVFLLFIISLALNFYLTYSQPTAAFYILPTRGWELAAGALVFLIAKQYRLPQQPLAWLYWLGWIMVIASFFIINEHFAWPGYWAILPVLGTSLIILAQREYCRLTDNSLAQWLGDRSYSLYLWHWPLVVALNFLNLQNEWSWVIGFFALSIVLAHYSYQFIEVPARKYLSKSRRLKEIAIIGAVGAVIGFTAISVRLLTFPDRIDHRIDAIAYQANNINTRGSECRPHGNEIDSPKCIFGADHTDAIVIGDSHSESIITTIGKAAHTYDKGVLFWGKRGCPTILNYKYQGTDPIEDNHLKTCNIFMKNGLEYFKSLSKQAPIFIINRAPIYIYGPNEANHPQSNQPFNTEYIDYNLDQISETACEISKTRQVYLMRPIPELGIDVPKTLIRNLLFEGKSEDIKISLTQYFERNKEIWKQQDQAAKQCGVKILNPLPYLCDTNYCYGSKNGQPLYLDDDHLNEFGNQFLKPLFEGIFK